WAALARCLDLAEAGGVLTESVRRALTFGKLSAPDADGFCRWAETGKVVNPVVFSMSLAELELSVRSTNCLEADGITTLVDLVIRTEEELLEVRNFGEKNLKEVKQKLQALGLSLGMPQSLVSAEAS